MSFSRTAGKKGLLLLGAFLSDRDLNFSDLILQVSWGDMNYVLVPLKKNNEDIVNTCIEIKQKLQKLGIGRILYENTGNIGKAYRRHDEVGTPICVTIDFESIKGDNPTVTVRDRDSMEQIKVAINDIVDYVKNYYIE